jgi:MFS transporter, OPA family, glycerol-3-phosphate transporter
MKSLLQIFKPAPHIARLPKDKIDPTYKKLRMQVFLGIFVGYAGYYLIRKNFSLAMPYLVKEGFTKGELGLILSALPIAYGLSKFIMGSVSDRSNARYFMATGLILSAVVNIIFGMSSVVLSNVSLMFILVFFNGWFQGMGWPPSGRTMVHWFTTSERGTWMSVWNVAHNIGGGLIGPLAILGIAIFGSWHSIFYFPAIIAIFIAIFVIVMTRCTPQSCGLPPIEEYNNEYPDEEEVKNREKEMTTKEILLKHVLNNKYLWYIAIANIFIYLVRYGVVDWAPTYLTEAKGYSHTGSDWAYFLYEYAGIPGTILCGYLSDKIFHGRRAPIGIIYMFFVIGAILVYWLAPAGNHLVINLALVAIGFLIYGPVMLIGVHAVDLVPKKAAGTAAGLTGLFGYLGGTVIANVGMGYIVDYCGWKGGFIMLIVSCFLAIFFLALTWNTGLTHVGKGRRRAS